MAVARWHFSSLHGHDVSGVGLVMETIAILPGLNI